MYQDDKDKMISFRVSSNTYELINGFYLSKKNEYFNLSLSEFLRNIVLGYILNQDNENKTEN